MSTNDFDPSAIKALAFDLDGTLLRPDKTLSERTLRALHSCIEKGLRLILDTGRSRDSGETFRKQIGMPGPHVYYNGAEVADMTAGKIIKTQFIESRLLLSSLRLARQLGLYYQVYFPAGTIDGPSLTGEKFGEVLMADRITAEAKSYEEVTGSPVMAGDLEQHLAETPVVIKGMFIVSEENLKKIRPVLDEQYGSSVYLTQSSPFFLEILAAGVSKGSGLLHALEYLGLTPEATIAFGDEENDIPMFKTAGFSAAPANAKEHVRNAAVFQIPANTEDGVAAFLEKELLSKFE